jgi:hypothetical protein
MKINFSKIFSIAVLIAMVFSACNESEDLITDGAKTGGLLDATSTSINYVVGQPEGPYTIEFFVNQGRQKTRTINLYKSFTKTVTWTITDDGEERDTSRTFTSNEVLATTINVTNDENHHVAASYDFNALREGLTIGYLDGTTGPLLEDDQQYSIGDRWTFRVETVLEDDRVVYQAYNVNISVSTRYAGRYRALVGEYYRLGVPTYSTSDWPDETVIESVDATTYRVVEYFGAAAFTGNTWYFQIIDGIISYPDKTPEGDDQTGNDQPFIDCESNPTDMAEVHCGSSNFVTNFDNGADRLTMSYGYNTPGSGPRTFYQVLEKIID